MQILLALFCAGIAIYAWRTWRRHPLYSLKTTLKAAGVFALGLTLVIVLTLLIASHLPSQSPAVITLCCMVVVAAITLGLIAASFRITDGPIAKPPRGTKPENCSRRKIYPWLLGAGVVFLGLLGWAALATPENAELLMILASLVLVCCVASLGSLYIKARRFDYAITALKADFWVHWQGESGQDEAWLGFDGMLAGNAYTPWLTSGNYLTEARAERVPAVTLLLTFVKIYGASGVPRTIRVSVPKGRESDVELLEGKLRARCPKARIDLGVASRARA